MKKFIDGSCACCAGRFASIIVPVLLLVGAATTASAQITKENQQPGSPASQWDVSGTGDPSIQGFATDISVNRGTTVNFKITAASAYTIDIYRMGYYRGNGARKVASLGTFSAGAPQPACLTDATTFLYDCGNWKISASWPVPNDSSTGIYALSGIYFAKLTTTTGKSSHIVFVVRDDSSRSDLLFQTSDQTWHAYNYYGGHSLYGSVDANGVGQFDLPNRAKKVSYNRPFYTRGMEGGASWVFNAEYPMVRWLEANGYDVTYFTGVDGARNGGLIKNHKVFLSVGHDEYWSKDQRSYVEEANAVGTHLAFFSGNTMFWKIRFESDAGGTANRTLVCYKETLDSALTDPTGIWTGTWRDPRFSPPADGGLPENAVIGTVFRVNGADVPPDKFSVPATYAAMRFWRNTSIVSLLPGQTARLPAGTLGYEWDVDEDNGFQPAGLVRFSQSRNTIAYNYLQDYGATYGPGIATHHLVLHRVPNGGLVFGAGTVQWSWGLDKFHDTPSYPAPAPDLRMKQATVNLFADMGVQPASLQKGLVAATASTDFQAPNSVITAPTATTLLKAGVTTVISGTAGDTGGGVVAGVEVSTDDGATWHPAAGLASWTFKWTPLVAGSATIKSRAADDSANLETPGTTGPNVVTVNVAPPTTFSVFLPTDTGPSSNDPAAVELGVKFQSSVAGHVKAIRFYKPNFSDGGTHIGNLWSAAGVNLGQVTFGTESASGWQQVSFVTPVAISASTTYVVSYYAPQGNYAASDGYFATAPKIYTSTNPPLTLTMLKDGTDGPNGVYHYYTGGGTYVATFPTDTFASSNYYVDIVFTNK